MFLIIYKYKLILYIKFSNILLGNCKIELYNYTIDIRTNVINNKRITANLRLKKFKNLKMMFIKHPKIYMLIRKNKYLIIYNYSLTIKISSYIIIFIKINVTLCNETKRFTQTYIWLDKSEIYFRVLSILLEVHVLYIWKFFTHSLHRTLINLRGRNYPTLGRNYPILFQVI